MAIYKRLFVFWIFMYTCLSTEEEGQWISRVIAFSSQFSNNGWSAKQIIGPQNVFPDYGANYKAWAPKDIDAKQFLEFEFLNRVNVSKIDIYETFNAGGVKAIKCKDVVTDTWITLWSTSKVSVIEESRIFSPSFTSTASCFSNRIRLDIDCTLAGTWVEIDAVRLHGYKDSPSTTTTSPSRTTTLVLTTGTTKYTQPASPTTTSTFKPSTSAIPTQSTSATSVSKMDGSTTAALAAGVSVTVAIAVSAVVIVLVLRNRKKFCFANTKRSNVDNRADDNHISLQNDLSKAPGAPMLNHTYSGVDIGNIKSKEHEASAFTDVTYQNTNNKHGNHVSETHAYFVLEKDGFELKRNAVNSTPTDVHDYFVLEKQQPNFGNRNGVLTNEVHPYFVLDKQGDQPVHDRPPNEANPYFVLEKQTTGNPSPIHTANALALEDTDGETYQEIDTDDTYAGIDDSREDNNDYDYTNKAFKDSRTEISDNVYNHLNAAGDEYDHLGKGQSNDEAMENNYDVTSSPVRK